MFDLLSQQHYICHISDQSTPSETPSRSADGMAATDSTPTQSDSVSASASGEPEQVPLEEKEDNSSGKQVMHKIYCHILFYLVFDIVKQCPRNMRCLFSIWNSFLMIEL